MPERSSLKTWLKSPRKLRFKSPVKSSKFKKPPSVNLGKRAGNELELAGLGLALASNEATYSRFRGRTAIPPDLFAHTAVAYAQR